MTTLKKVNGFVEVKQGTETTKGAEFMYKRLRSQEVAVAEVVEDKVEIEIPRFNVPQQQDNVIHVDFGYQEEVEQPAKKTSITWSFICMSLAGGAISSLVAMLVLYGVACIGANVTMDDVKNIFTVGMWPMKLSLFPVGLGLIVKFIKEI